LRKYAHLNNENNRFLYDLSPERSNYYKNLIEVHKKHEMDKKKEHREKSGVRRKAPKNDPDNLKDMTD
jgi:hypothetical protein